MKQHKLNKTLLNKKGYTVVEVLVALVLFSLIFSSLSGLLIAESKLQRKYEDKAIAVQIAKTEIEKVKSSHWSLKDQKYQIEMAGRNWNVRRVIANDSGMIALGQEFIQPQHIIVSVTREHDTLTLAEFQVMKEIYR